MRIKHNISSLNTNNRLTQNKKKADSVLEKLSSGYKINHAGDDAAGLAISEKMRGQIRGLNMAGKNIQDGISLIQTAEGALNEVHSLLQRARELSVQAANDTNTDSDRAKIQMELEEIKKEITSIGNNTEFNTKKLLNGALKISPPSPPSPPSPTSSLTITEKYNNDNKVGPVTAEDGWIEFNSASNPKEDPNQKNKIKLNEGEKVIDDPDNGLFTKNLWIAVRYVKGVAEKLTIYTLPEGHIITKDNTNLLFSYNGMTIDVRHRKVPNEDPINYIEGVIDLTAGENQPTESTDPTDGLKLQIGANSGQTTELTIPDIRSQAIGINDVSVLDSSLAQSSISSFNSAINIVSSVRSSLGAHQNRLEYAYNSVTKTSENLQSAESRIRDTDMAKGMIIFTKNNILLQAAQAMLAQSNKQPEGTLQLLK
ncbi:flagellar hook-associated protein FlgL [Lysinibacillus sp. NPDC056232]|uniref:flagellar hook-associated protein FlgL n=1 Tax=Lysinibacillus sp. NPDC056232 TaxID=3345756 RepID=UPI0035DF60B8